MSSKMENQSVTFFVNGRKIVDNEVDPEWTLAWYIREKLGLTGTKLACEEGQCGSCTVLLAKYSKERGKPRYSAVNSCLIPAVAVHGCAITTVEGIGSVRTKLHPVQERLAKGHGTQCGFCTPGFVMSMYSLLRNSPKPTVQQIETALQGNLCRCTGYRSIIESFCTFSQEGCGAKYCCKNKQEENGVYLTDWQCCASYGPTQDPIFPPELQIDRKYDEEDLSISGPRVDFYRPVTMNKLLELKRSFPDAELIGAATLIGLMERYSSRAHATWISAMGVEELKYSRTDEKYLEFGAGLTLSELQETLRQACAVLSGESS